MIVQSPFHLKHWMAWHVIAALVISAILALILVIELRTQIPVDLREIPIPERFEAAPLRALEPRYYPGFDLLASRHVLNDLSSKGVYLQDETLHFKDDAFYYWYNWKNYVGIRGGLLDWFWISGTGSSANNASRRSWEGRLQAQIFNLNGIGQILNARSDKLVSHLKLADEDWRELKDRMTRNAASGSDLSSLHASFDDFKGRLERLADEVNDIDKGIQEQEQLMDETYSRMNAYFEENFPSQYVSNSIRARTPYHWNSLVSDTPRPLIHYDFKTQYKEYFDRSPSEIRSVFPTSKTSLD